VATKHSGCCFYWSYKGKNQGFAVFVYQLSIELQQNADILALSGFEDSWYD